MDWPLLHRGARMAGPLHIDMYYSPRESNALDQSLGAALGSEPGTCRTLSETEYARKEMLSCEICAWQMPSQTKSVPDEHWIKVDSDQL